MSEAKIDCCKNCKKKGNKKTCGTCWYFQPFFGSSRGWCYEISLEVDSDEEACSGWRSYLDPEIP